VRQSWRLVISSKDRVELVRYPLKHRAVVNGRDKRNHTPLDVAKGSGWNDKAIVAATAEKRVDNHDLVHSSISLITDRPVDDGQMGNPKYEEANNEIRHSRFGDADS